MIISSTILFFCSLSVGMAVTCAITMRKSSKNKTTHISELTKEEKEEISKYEELYSVDGNKKLINNLHKREREQNQKLCLQYIQCCVWKAMEKGETEVVLPYVSFSAYTGYYLPALMNILQEKGYQIKITNGTIQETILQAALNKQSITIYWSEKK